MVTQSQVALQAIALVKALTEIHNTKYPLQEFKELPPDNKGNPSWMTFCPAHNDISTPSLHVSYLDKVLVKCRAGCGPAKVIDKLKELYLWNSAHVKSKFQINIPAHTEPEDAELMEVTLNEEGVTPNEIYSYRTANNEPVFWVLRANTKPKIIKPYCSVTYLETNQVKFAQVHIPNNRPLYNLPQVAVSQQIMIVEGEKTVEAARELFPQYCITTWAGGTGAIAQTTWEILKGKDITLWPDNDVPGIKAMEDIAKRLFSKDPKANIKLVFSQVIPTLEKGWDLANVEPGDNGPETMLNEAQELEPGDLSGPIVGDLKMLFEEYDKRLVFVQQDRDILIINTAKQRALDDEAFPYVTYPYGSRSCYAYENNMIEVLGSKKPIYAIDEYVSRLGDKLHNDFTYNPTTIDRTITQGSMRYFNLFSGFAYKPIESNKTDLILNFINMLLKENAGYVLDWIAHIIQDPGTKPGTFILLIGDEGTGKSFLGQLICKVLGARNTRFLRSNNLHDKFTELLTGKLFIYTDELTFGRSRMERHLLEEFKALITANSLVIDEKHVRKRSEPSYHRFMASTNNRQPYSIDFNTRRDAIFEVDSHTNANNISYFTPLYKALHDEETMAGFMHFLVNRKIRSNLLRAPETGAKQRMYEPTDPVLAFIYNILWTGDFPSEFNVYYLKSDTRPEISKWPNETVHLPRSAIVEYIQTKYHLSQTRSISSQIIKALEQANNKNQWQALFEVHERGSVTTIKKDTFAFAPLVKLREVFTLTQNLTIQWPYIIDIPPDANNIHPLRRDAF